MRPLSHIEIAHSIWKLIVQPGCTAVDATCGNGHDSYFLASLGAKVIGFDVQKSAIEETASCLKEFRDVTLYEMCHSKMHEVIPPKSVKLIAFNLGYLPGGDKQVTTMLTSTLKAIQTSLDLIMPGGLISITCYPGHSEGELEEQAILSFIATLKQEEWSISSYRTINRQKAPHLISVLRL